MTLLISVEFLQKNKEIFTPRDVLEKLNIQEPEISHWTEGDTSKKKKYGYFQCRKKRLLSPKDFAVRLKFANQCKKLPTNFWIEGCYFLGPQKQSSIPCKNNLHKNMEKENARTQTGSCTKVNKEESWGHVAKFIVALSHSKVIVKCYQYKGRINGEKFAKFILEEFPDMFLKGNN